MLLNDAVYIQTFFYVQRLTSLGNEHWKATDNGTELVMTLGVQSNRSPPLPLPIQVMFVTPELISSVRNQF